MEDKVDLKDLFSSILRKWILLIVFAVIFAVAFNVYGYRTEINKQTEDVALHTKYEETVTELPAYYTEELFRLRNNLNDNSAAFCEAYAEVYKSYISAYKSESLTTDSAQLQAYMMFMDSYKDVLSVMSGNERSYYNALIATKTDTQVENHPVVESFTLSAVSVVQPKWLVLGFIAGLFVCAAGITISFVFKKKK